MKRVPGTIPTERDVSGTRYRYVCLTCMHGATATVPTFEGPRSAVHESCRRRSRSRCRYVLLRKLSPDSYRNDVASGFEMLEALIHKFLSKMNARY